MRVQVAIDLALDRLFTYEAPRELEKKLAVGQLLSVPFGHREARGFAMAVSPAEAGGGLTTQPPAKRLESQEREAWGRAESTTPPHGNAGSTKSCSFAFAFFFSTAAGRAVLRTVSSGAAV